jgi:hypothetical protein
VLCTWRLAVLRLAGHGAMARETLGMAVVENEPSMQGVSFG